MITQPFAAGEVVGKVKGANAVNDAFETAIYTLKLRSLYPELSPLLQSAFEAKADGGQDMAMNLSAMILPEVQAALTISNAMNEFCHIAPRISELHTPDQQLWKRAKDATAQEVESMFMLWREDAEFKTAVDKALAALDRPNGVEGAADAQLTEAERNDPLSLPPAPNGKSRKNANITT